MVRLGEVCEVNPRKKKTEQSDQYSFVGMADLDAETARTQSRLIADNEIKSGLTHFKANDILVAKITPCFENCKIGIATIPTELGIGSTEFHVIRANESQINGLFRFQSA